MAAWPQWTMAALLAIGLIYSLYTDGQKQSVSGAFITLLVNGGQIAILYYGGFWVVWGFTP